MEKLTRRNFVNGSAVALGATAFPLSLGAALASGATAYPPRLTGLRGNHPGANTHAHARAWQTDFRAGSVIDTTESYDLVIVGAGLSGLAAAFFLSTSIRSRQKDSDSR
jgi:spermidine dehydrogenase